jgi:hypothetical protein
MTITGANKSKIVFTIALLAPTGYHREGSLKLLVHSHLRALTTVVRPSVTLSLLSLMRPLVEDASLRIYRIKIRKEKTMPEAGKVVAKKKLKNKAGNAVEEAVDKVLGRNDTPREKLEDRDEDRNNSRLRDREKDRR